MKSTASVFEVLNTFRNVIEKSVSIFVRTYKDYLFPFQDSVVNGES
jgi:hypothetical protein